jgi:hypothetical protein
MRSLPTFGAWFACALALALPQAAHAETADARLRALLAEQAKAPATARTQRWTPGDGATVRLPLPAFVGLWRGYLATLPKQGPRRGPAVVLAESHYEARLTQRGLGATLKLSVELDHPGQWKLVPLVGAEVALRSATLAGKPLALARRRGYHVWPTRKAGRVTLEIDFVAAPSGPRGSTAIAFDVAKTPITRFSCLYPSGGQRPRVAGAVTTTERLEAATPPARSPRAKRLEATLRPTARLELLGLRARDGSAKRARLYADTRSLLSLGAGRFELFSVLRYTALHAPVDTLRVALPPKVRVVSVEGQGGLRTRVEGSVLIATLARPFRGRYELSLRLRGSSGERLEVPLPRCLDTVRDSGWLAVEVTGKLRVAEHQRAALRPVDLRQLPTELLSSAVHPILLAYRYHQPRRRLTLQAEPLPEVPLPPAPVDRARAFSVVSRSGDVLTELRLTLRNRLRRDLRLRLPEGATIRSALLDGRPVKPSRAADGQLLLPLRRSRAAVGLTADAQTLQLVIADKTAPPRWLGRLGLRLPAVSLPVATLAWSVYLPHGNRYGALRGSSALQRPAGSVRWERPPRVAGRSARRARAPQGPRALASASVESGALPVRIRLPKQGQRLEYTQHWLPAARSARVASPYIARELLLPLATLSWFGLFAALLVALGRGRLDRERRWRRARMGAALGLASACGWCLVALGSAGWIVVALLCAVAIAALRRGGLTSTWRRLFDWARTLPARYREAHPPRSETPGRRAALRRIALSASAVLLGLTWVSLLFKLLALLGHRLPG